MHTKKHQVAGPTGELDVCMLSEQSGTDTGFLSLVATMGKYPLKILPNRRHLLLRHSLLFDAPEQELKLHAWLVPGCLLLLRFCWLPF